MTEIIEVRRRDKTRDTDKVKNMKTDLSRQQKFKLFSTFVPRYTELLPQ
jgi:hypothetical protein